ncbi:hypothetical protein R6U49_12955 [Pseudomonas aeruginosa]|uniref:hypothetical protein n=1 Tax=Pseudomonas aeruginosa TaxID=287 RepID=UPI0003B1C286|nr:hypothetical protein [Pseudomonas aeruginosa]EKW6218768.1 hypothetical protein [Pseudomonas aeruginosa]UXJ49363.1 hypothetical protein N6T38_31110 [Pseudomonas aeruginosa]WRH55003.1 hypothetical protein R6U49_12955 [Pseudomonas aeruginosa]HBO4593461.1 hypothetical protein [Pseudomonas aeruginosa]
MTNYKPVDYRTKKVVRVTFDKDGRVVASPIEEAPVQKATSRVSAQEALDIASSAELYKAKDDSPLELAKELGSYVMLYQKSPTFTNLKRISDHSEVGHKLAHEIALAEFKA